MPPPPRRALPVISERTSQNHRTPVFPDSCQDPPLVTIPRPDKDSNHAFRVMVGGALVAGATYANHVKRKQVELLKQYVKETMARLQENNFRGNQDSHILLLW